MLVDDDDEDLCDDYGGVGGVLAANTDIKACSGNCSDRPTVDFAVPFVVCGGYWSSCISHYSFVSGRGFPYVYV